MTSSLSLAKVIAFSERHLPVADIEIGSRRVSDVLNDSLSNHLTLSHVRINRSERLDESIATFDSVTVRKSVIQGLLILAEPIRAPHQRIANYVAKTPFRVGVLIPAFFIVGDIMIGGKIDPAVQVLEGPEPFVALTDAQVTLTSRAGAPIAVPTALINRSRIELASAEPRSS